MGVTCVRLNLFKTGKSRPHSLENASLIFDARSVYTKSRTCLFQERDLRTKFYFAPRCFFANCVNMYKEEFVGHWYSHDSPCFLIMRKSISTGDNSKHSLLPTLSEIFLNICNSISCSFCMIFYFCEFYKFNSQSMNVITFCIPGQLI